jgi:hypothetical protein
MIDGNCVVVVSAQQVSCDLGGEAVILDMQKGKYFGLNGVGSRVWELVQQPRSVEEIRDQLLIEFDVDRERCERELSVLLHDLAEHGLIRLNGSNT